MTNKDYTTFKETYNIVLNEQQDKAVQAIDGATLLLAVPGSGKTTVLVARLGYMILCKGISPQNILAITYTKAATADMRSRFASKFGEELSKGVEFRTINGISELIIRHHAKMKNRHPFTLLAEEGKKNAIIRDILIKTQKSYPTDNDIIEAETMITYIKNMMLSDVEIRALKTTISDIYTVYTLYKSTLTQMRLMDYDDQIVFALTILRTCPDILDEFQEKFRYICVDEAQDTAKIQHKMIQLLAQKYNNIFMVGDEDQSIYGFRAAYPQALICFDKDYPNSNVLYMETNYRSTVEIVDKAARFISNNTNRYDKHMIPSNGHGRVVERIYVTDRAVQFDKMVGIAQTADENTAILYRENDSAVPLVDLLLRNNVPFQMSRTKALFFTNRVVVDVQAFLRLAINPYDSEAFMQIYYKGGYYFNKKFAEEIRDCMTREKLSVFDALDKHLESWPSLEDGIRLFKRDFEDMSKSNTKKALDCVYDCYSLYMTQNQLGFNKFELLYVLAKPEPTITGFLERIKELHQIFASNKFIGNSGIKLSTIHSAKGLEYDSVYLIDVFDSIFPVVDISSPRVSEADRELYQEERRLFYVAITRAKHNLAIMSIRHEKTDFIDELFYQESLLSQKKPKKKEETSKKQSEKKEKQKKPKVNKGYEEVKNLFTQQTEQIKDSSGKRWVQCEMCKEIKPETEFVSYGGVNHVNLGVCYECDKIKQAT